MTGIVKILAKEIVELAHRPFLLIWLVAVPMLLTLVAGYISKDEPHAILVLSAYGQDEKETDRVRQLLKEIAGLVVVEVKDPVSDIVAVMERERAGLALSGRDDRWQVIERSSSRAQHRQLISFAYEIATSLNLNRPWQLAAAESATSTPPISSSPPPPPLPRPPPLPPVENVTESPPSTASTEARRHLPKMPTKPHHRGPKVLLRPNNHDSKAAAATLPSRPKGVSETPLSSAGRVTDTSPSRPESASEVPSSSAGGAADTSPSGSESAGESPSPLAEKATDAQPRAASDRATVLSLSVSDRRGEIWLVAYVIALVIVFLPFMMTCNSLIREQDVATLERLLVAPGVSWIALVIGKAVLPLLLGTVELFLLMLFSGVVFHTEPGPAGPLTPAIQILAILSSTCLGVAIATVVRSQLQGYFLSALYLVCLVLFTGFTFPVSQAQLLIQLTSNLFPLTFSLEPLSAWMLLGTDGRVYGPELKFLLVQCAAYAGLATLGTLLYRGRV